jgi:DNA-binding NtrC family response regulator
MKMNLHKIFHEIFGLNILKVHLPPLRERLECIEPLAGYLLEKTCRELRKKVDGFTPEVLETFENYSWPGNIRQLANTIERAAILENSNLIHAQNVVLPELRRVVMSEHNTSGQPRPAESLEDREKESIIQALEDSLWIQKDAARKLGITPRALNYKIKKFGITHTRWRKNK